MEKTKYKCLEWFTVVFVVMLLISNIIAGKIVSLNGVIIPAAVFLFPFTYIFGDIIT
jgi:queuosine precursor transporter